MVGDHPGRGAPSRRATRRTPSRPFSAEWRPNWPHCSTTWWRATTPSSGSCYGIGTLGRHQGAVVDRTYGEPISGVQITVTEAGLSDPLFSVAGPSFGAYLGHKEAILKLPAHAVTLATSAHCPVQAFRVGTRVYATQFHSELDLEGLAIRVEVYRYAGYFRPEEAEAVLAAARASGITETPNLLARFVELFSA